VDFYEREDGSPEVGDKANVNGTAAEGVHIMANGDTYTFNAGGIRNYRNAKQ
jgi:hypothetical protein